MVKQFRCFVTVGICTVVLQAQLQSQLLLSNIEGRNSVSLNGKWSIVIDPFDAGNGTWKPIWKDQHPVGKHDFFEYQFNKAITLNVPGDWNSQRAELLYYEGTVWYEKSFHFQKKTGEEDIYLFWRRQL